jgi:hypothetical protein
MSSDGPKIFWNVQGRGRWSLGVIKPTTHPVGRSAAGLSNRRPPSLTDGPKGWAYEYHEGGTEGTVLGSKCSQSGNLNALIVSGSGHENSKN